MKNEKRVETPPADHLGFRLSAAETLMYSAPDSSSRILANLSEGTVVTVLQSDGDFLQIVTEDDRFGYIPNLAPMSAVEGRSVKDWNTLLPDLPPSPTLEMAGIHAPRETAHPPSAPELRALEPSRQRNARIFVNRINEEDRGAPQSYFSGVVSATVGLVGLLLAHAISRMTIEELGVFFMADVLFPLFVLTSNPRAPVGLFGIAMALYLSALFGYVAI